MAELSAPEILKGYEGIRIIDPHIHRAGHLESPQQIIEYLNKHNVEIGFLIPSALKEGKGSKGEDMLGPMKLWVGGWGNSTFGHLASDYLIRPLAKGMFVKEPDNKGVIAATEEHPDRLMAWIWANPQKEIQKTLDEMNEFLRRPNVVGSKLHFWIFPTKITNPNVMQIAELTQETNKPILIDVGVNRGNMREFDEFARTHPRIPIIAAHLGSFLPEVVESARTHTNVYLDMSGYPVTAANLKKVLRIISADKIIFGSDSPGGISGSLVSQLRALHGAGISPREQELILTGNIKDIVPKAAEIIKARDSQRG